MAINKTDNFERELFTFDLIVGGSEDNTSQISGLRGGTIALEVSATGLDANVNLEPLQGNTDNISKMSPILDANGVVISDSLTNGEYFIITDMEGVYLGLQLDVLTATTGTVTITGRI